jgi:poly(3-hydroxybutyrate) depolymerase
MAGMKASSIVAVCGLIVASGAMIARSASAARPYARAPVARVRIWSIRYRAHDGRLRRAFVELPAWYGPRRHPAIPLVISPHGRGVPAEDELRRWGDLPALGRFAVVHPEGEGRRLTLFAWGDPGDIADLAKMPRFVEGALPWLHVDRRRLYAFGGSMGGQETLLLVARHPALLAGAAAFDAPTNMAARYDAMTLLPFGRVLQRLARVEIGGTPATDPRGYAIRSPLDWARQIAFSGVPLQIWWSTRDDIVVDQREESGALYRKIERLNPRAPVREFVGTWPHTMEMRAVTRLPIALGLFGLVPPSAAHYGAGISRGVPLARTCRWTRRRAECGPLRPLPDRRSGGGRWAHVSSEAARHTGRFTPARSRGSSQRRR